MLSGADSPAPRRETTRSETLADSVRKRIAQLRIRARLRAETGCEWARVGTHFDAQYGALIVAPAALEGVENGASSGIFCTRVSAEFAPADSPQGVPRRPEDSARVTDFAPAKLEA
jgi:hypothetical protein